MNSWPALRRRTDDKGLVQAPCLTTTPGSLLGAVWVGCELRLTIPHHVPRVNPGSEPVQPPRLTGVWTVSDTHTQHIQES